MVKSKVSRTKAKGSGLQNSKEQSVSAKGSGDYHALGGLHCLLAAPYQHTQNGELSGRSVDGSVELYVGLKPQSALQSILSTLIVNVSNATNECLFLAAKIPPSELQHRDINLRHAFKGAAVVTQLVDALERVRGKRRGNVNVGNVNVESGGQAIVGTVQSKPREKELEDAASSDHAKAPSAK